MTAAATPEGLPGRLRSSEREVAGFAARELASAFSIAIAAGDSSRLAGLLGGDVVYLAPGRGPVAGRHRGRDAVVAALTVSPVAGVVLDDTAVTETFIEGHRGLIVYRLRGTIDGDRFDYEIALHIQTDGAHISGITEYSGDQYTADRLLGTVRPDSGAGSRSRPWRRPGRQRRRHSN